MKNISSWRGKPRIIRSAVGVMGVLGSGVGPDDTGVIRMCQYQTIFRHNQLEVIPHIAKYTDAE